jgi:hypothetical protein
MKAIKTVRLMFTVYISVVSLISANAQPPALPICSDQGNWSTQRFLSGADTVKITTPLLLTDGRVMVQYRGGLSTGHPWQDWYALTPGAKGCYSLNAADCGGASLVATWSELASLTTVTCPPVPAYGPIAFASAVLPNGNVIVEGGEDNLAVASRVESDCGAYYNAVANTWTYVAPPTGWTNIGDAPATVLADGTFMLGNACGNLSGVGQTALFDVATLGWNTMAQPPQWTAEASFTLLPDNSVVFVSTCWPGQPVGNTCSTLTSSLNSEAYNPTTGTWGSLGNTTARLYSYDSTGTVGRNRCFAGQPYFGEQGPAALMPNGTYFATGGHNVAANAVLTSVYDTNTKKWVSSPNLPTVTIGTSTYSLSAADQGAVVLTDGNVLFSTLTGGIQNEDASGTVYYLEWNGNSYCQLNNLPVGIPLQSEMLTLPTGQIFITDVSWLQDDDYFIYTPGGTTYPGIAPTLASLSATTLVIGSTYTATGTQFNGATQSSFFGDDFQNYTNYPLIRITNNTTGDVFYAKTQNPSTMGVATGNLPTTTSFTVPSDATVGDSTIVVVANGIPSNSLKVTLEK